MRIIKFQLLTNACVRVRRFCKGFSQWCFHSFTLLMPLLSAVCQSVSSQSVSHCWSRVQARLGGRMKSFAVGPFQKALHTVVNGKWFVFTIIVT